MKSIQQRVRKLRQQCNELIEEAAAQARQDVRRRQVHFEDEARQLTTSMYTNLWRRIFTGVGVGDVTDFCSQGYVVWCNNSEEVETLRRLVRSFCGIDIWIDPNRKERHLAMAALDTALAKTCYVFRRDLADKLTCSDAATPTAQTCQVVWHHSDADENTTGEHQKRTGELVYTKPLQRSNVIHRLDFPALVQENRRRNRLWYEQLDDIAKHLLDECRASLELVPDKCYGLDTNIELKRLDGGSLIKSFKFDTQQMAYCNLSNSRRNELLAYANSLIRGGKISFVRDIESVWQVHIQRCVPWYGTAQPYFDYGKFCAQHETWSSRELVEDLAQLVDGLALTSDLEQVPTLQPKRELHYVFNIWDFDGPCYDLFYRSLRREPPVSGMSIAEKLLETVRTAFPGIQVKDASCVRIGTERFCIDPQYDRWESLPALSIQFEMAAMAQCCDLLKAQHRIEQTITRIRQHKIQYLSTEIVEIILGRIETHRVSTYFDAKTMVTHMSTIYNDNLYIRLNDDLDQYCVNLAKIKDPAFLAKIDQAVCKKTGGFIKTNLRDKWFILQP